MKKSSVNNRIIFLDLIRALAVLMMVQGHTLDALLANEYRNLDSVFYSTWNFFRGLTAPAFMFTAGAVFTYLLRLDNSPFAENERVKKGFKRFLTLVGIGYLLRYPTPTLVYFGNVTAEQWKIFFTVDALHLIGFGILFILGFIYLSEKSNLSDYITLGTGALIFFGLNSYFAQINWSDYFPLPIAGYFYSKTGSIFPLFPWIGYVLSGAILGSYLAKNPKIYKEKSFCRNMIFLGLLFLSASAIGDSIERSLYGESFFYSTSPNLIMFRLGMVILMNGAAALFALRIDRIPNLLVQIGRHTLTIYIVHLVIIYGSPWSVGISWLIGGSMTPAASVAIAAAMVASMVAMVYLIAQRRLKISRAINSPIN